MYLQLIYIRNVILKFLPCFKNCTQQNQQVASNENPWSSASVCCSSESPSRTAKPLVAGLQPRVCDPVSLRWDSGICTF